MLTAADFNYSHAEQAVGHGRMGVFDWLLAVNPAIQLTEALAEEAVHSKSLSMLQLVHSLGCPLPSRCFSWHLRNNLEMLVWLHSKGCPLDGYQARSLLIRAEGGVFAWVMATFLQGDASFCYSDVLHFSHGRLLYMHGKGWPCPDPFQTGRLRDAQQRYCAFYGAACWLAKQPSQLATLGSLDGELVQRIACLAHLDFSEFYTDDGSNFGD